MLDAELSQSIVKKISCAEGVQIRFISLERWPKPGRSNTMTRRVSAAKSINPLVSKFSICEPLIGMFIAGAGAFKGKSGSLAVDRAQSHFSVVIGLVVFAALLAAFFRATARQS
jgi:hypothetical protein